MKKFLVFCLIIMGFTFSKELDIPKPKPPEYIKAPRLYFFRDDTVGGIGSGLVATPTYLKGIVSDSAGKWRDSVAQHRTEIDSIQTQVKDHWADSNQTGGWASYHHLYNTYNGTKNINTTGNDITIKSPYNNTLGELGLDSLGNIKFGLENDLNLTSEAYDNIYMGRFTGKYAYKPFYDIGIGRSVLVYDSSGYSNLGMMTQALYNLRSGFLNAGIMPEALYSLTSGYWDLGFGYDAFWSATTMKYSIAFGNGNSMKSNGDYQTKIGTYSDRWSRTSLASTTLGYKTLYGVEDSSDTWGMTAIGAFAGLNVRSGAARDIIMGYYCAPNLTTASYGIFIGDSLIIDSPTTDYQLNIGNALKGNLSTKDLNTPGNFTISANNKAFKMYDVSSTARELLKLNSSNNTVLSTGGTAGSILVQTGGGGAVTRFTVNESGLGLFSIGATSPYFHIGSDTTYGLTWLNNPTAASKAKVYDKIESLDIWLKADSNTTKNPMTLSYGQTNFFYISDTNTTKNPITWDYLLSNYYTATLTQDSLTAKLNRSEIILAKGSMYFNDNAGTQTPTAGDTLGITQFTQGNLKGFSFDAGSEGTYTVVADNGDGRVRLYSTTHGLSTGDWIFLNDGNYNGVYQVTVSNADSIIITATFGATDAGNWQEPSRLTLTQSGITSEIFHAEWSIGGSVSGTPAGDDVRWGVYVNNRDYVSTHMRRTLSTGSEYGSFGNTAGEVIMSTGDSVFMFFISDDTNALNNYNGSFRVSAN